MRKEESTNSTQASAQEATMHCVLGMPYRGYNSTYCGAGRLVFIGPQGDEATGSSVSALGWLEEAWMEVKAQIDERVDKPLLMREI